MTEQPSAEEFRLDIDPIDSYLKQTPAVIARRKADTANVLAILLVVAVIVSLPLHLLSVWLGPEATDAITAVSDKWYAIISPLAGAAVGAYYATRSTPGREE